MTTQGAIYWALITLILLGLKLVPDRSVPWARDPGPAPGERYPVWDRWSWWHLLVPGIIAGVPLGLGWAGYTTTAIFGLLLIVGWELVEGFVSDSDLYLGGISIALAELTIAIFRR